MKRIVAALLLSATAASAATVTNYITDSGGYPLNTWVTFYPTNTPQIIGITNVIDVPVRTKTTRGAWSINLAGGIYAADQGYGLLELILVPPDEAGPYSFAQVRGFATNSLTTFAWTNTMPTISDYVWPGPGTQFTTNNPGAGNESIMISATFDGAGFGTAAYSNYTDFITPAQLDAAVGTNITLHAGENITITNADASNAWISSTSGAGITNDQYLPGTPRTAMLILSNSPTVHEPSLAFYPQDTNAWHGSFVDFHRPNNTVPQYLRWYNDSSTEDSIVETNQGWFGVGTDVASPNNTFFAMYDQVSGIDVFTIGMWYSNRAHVAINAVPDPTATFSITDPDVYATTSYAWLTNNLYTMQVISRTNVPTGTLLSSYSVKYDSLDLYRNPGSANFIRFQQGTSGYDWRVGGVGNNLDFITSAGTAGTTAYAPGDTVMSLVGTSSKTNNYVLAHGLRVSSNAPVWFSNNITAFYPAITDPWFGNYIDFHRPNNEIPQYLRWFNDGWDEPTIVQSEVGRPSWFGIGTDVANASNSFWCIYDQVSGIDALSIGMARSNRAHLGINTIPDPTVTLLITDPDVLASTNYTWLTNNTRTMEVVTRTNVPTGTILYGYRTKYDGLDLYRNVNAANFLKFRQGVSGYDWRIGGVGNNLEFLSTTGAVATTAYAPGHPVLTLTPSYVVGTFYGDGAGLSNIASISITNTIEANIANYATNTLGGITNALGFFPATNGAVAASGITNYQDGVTLSNLTVTGSLTVDATNDTTTVSNWVATGTGQIDGVLTVNDRIDFNSLRFISPPGASAWSGAGARVAVIVGATNLQAGTMLFQGATNEMMGNGSGITNIPVSALVSNEFFYAAGGETGPSTVSAGTVVSTNFVGDGTSISNVISTAVTNATGILAITAQQTNAANILAITAQQTNQTQILALTAQQTNQTQILALTAQQTNQTQILALTAQQTNAANIVAQGTNVLSGGGTAGQVLTATATGSAWSNAASAIESAPAGRLARLWATNGVPVWVTGEDDTFWESFRGYWNINANFTISGLYMAGWLGGGITSGLIPGGFPDTGWGRIASYPTNIGSYTAMRRLNGSALSGSPILSNAWIEASIVLTGTDFTNSIYSMGLANANTLDTATYATEWVANWNWSTNWIAYTRYVSTYTYFTSTIPIVQSNRLTLAVSIPYTNTVTFYTNNAVATTVAYGVPSASFYPWIVNIAAKTNGSANPNYLWIDWFSGKWQ